MISFVRRSLSVVLCALVTAPAFAQDTPARQEEVRPAITSFWGDTGLWFVPTAEVLKPGGWAFGAYRTELDFKQGSTDVAYYPGTLAIGAGPRTEIFVPVGVVGVVTGAILLARSGAPKVEKKDGEEKKEGEAEKKDAFLRHLRVVPGAPGANVGGLSLVGRF